MIYIKFCPEYLNIRFNIPVGTEGTDIDYVSPHLPETCRNVAQNFQWVKIDSSWPKPYLQKMPQTFVPRGNILYNCLKKCRTHYRPPWELCSTGATSPKWEKNESSFLFDYKFPVNCSMVVLYVPVPIPWNKHRNCRSQINRMLFWGSWKVSEPPACTDVEKSCLILLPGSIMSDNCIT